MTSSVSSSQPPNRAHPSGRAQTEDLVSSLFGFGALAASWARSFSNTVQTAAILPHVHAESSLRFVTSRRLRGTPSPSDRSRERADVSVAGALTSSLMTTASMTPSRVVPGQNGAHQRLTSGSSSPRPAQIERHALCSRIGGCPQLKLEPAPRTPSNRLRRRVRSSSDTSGGACVRSFSCLSCSAVTAAALADRTRPLPPALRSGRDLEPEGSSGCQQNVRDGGDDARAPAVPQLFPKNGVRVAAEVTRALFTEVSNSSRGY